MIEAIEKAITELFTDLLVAADAAHEVHTAITAYLKKKYGPMYVYSFLSPDPQEREDAKTALRASRRDPAVRYYDYKSAYERIAQRLQSEMEREIESIIGNPIEVVFVYNRKAKTFHGFARNADKKSVFFKTFYPRGLDLYELEIGYRVKPIN